MIKRLTLLISGICMLWLTVHGQSYNFYYGNLHCHTGYSDGNQDSATTGYSMPSQDYNYAKQSLHLNFIGISDHNHYQAGMKTPVDYHSGVSQATAANDNGNFVCLYGMEWGVISGGGHVIIYGIDSLIGWDKQADGITNDYDIYCAKSDYTSLWNIVKARPNAFCTLAHPNSTDFGNLLGTTFSTLADSVITGTASRSGSAFSTTTNYTDPAATSYESYYKQLLAKGYHVAPQVDADNHNTTFGRTVQGRTVVLATVLNRDTILSALKKRRYYASDDWDVQVNFTVAGNYMGTIANSTVNPTISVSVTDPDAGDNVSSIQIYYGVPGSGTIATILTSNTSNSSLSYTPSIALGSSYYYYAKITQADGDIMLTAPVWITKTPVNDDAPGALLLTVNGGCSGSPYTNQAATQSTGEKFASCKGTAGYRTVWFKFVAPSSGAVRISSDYSGGTMAADSRVALFSATNVNDYTTFSNIACDDDNGVTVAGRSILYAAGLTSGNTYYVEVDGKDTSGAGTFCLAVSEMTSGMLSSVTNCTSGKTLSNVNDNYTGWLSATDASGNLIALIRNNSGSATTSTYSASLNINSTATRNDGAGRRYLDRNFYISNATVSNATVRFFFLNSELSNLHAADSVVTLSNLQVTKQAGNSCAGDFVPGNGVSVPIPQISNGAGTGFGWIDVNTNGFSNFYLNTPQSYIAVKAFLQGAFRQSLSRHRDVSATWALALNNNALSQPYSGGSFLYNGTESVSNGFFASTANPTDITDWILVELHDAATPATIVQRRAALIREDGRVVDLDGVSDVSFRNLADANYFIVLRHRNHLSVRSSITQATKSALGYTAQLFDFSASVAQAAQTTTTAPMVEFSPGVWSLWGGNANGGLSQSGAYSAVRASGSNTVSNPLNDLSYLLNTVLLGNTTTILGTSSSPVYDPADVTLDGFIRASGTNADASRLNDYTFLLNTVLGGNTLLVLLQNQ